MAVLKKTRGILARFKRDESGIAAISWALSLTAILGAVGAATDFAMLSAADARSQTIADTTALAAAVYVKNNEQIPENRTDGLIGDYTAAELGFEYRNWVIDGSEGVDINVSYDNVNREATVTVVGKTRPTLMQILGFEELQFSAQSVVKYYERDLQDPASIVLVLDNSGSMHFDDIPVSTTTKIPPPEATERMDALKSSAKNFMTLLESAVGPQPKDGSVDLTLRTGMMAFDSAIVRTYPMDWGYVPESEINAMTPLAATNSAPPMSVAKTWLTETEPPIHERNLPGKTPLKYLVLMTDGKNTVGNQQWVARTGTENWRSWVTGREDRTGLTDVQTTQVEVVPEVCEMRERYRRMADYEWYGTHWTGRWDNQIRTPSNHNSNKWGPYRIFSDPSPQEHEVCTPAEYETRYSGWEYHEGENPPDNSGSWEEGEFDITSNIQTRAECDALHAAGVEVFTIGFALVPGQFGVNNWPGRASYGNHYPPDEDPYTGAVYTEEAGIENANKARAILQYCASKPENFITAEDSSALEAAFDRIGNTIIKEIIRISS